MYPFKDRVLNIAILISALWHFVFMFSIKPVLPVGHITERNTSIAFLGDILESVGTYITEDPSAHPSEISLKMPGFSGLRPSASFGTFFGHRPQDQIKFSKPILVGDKMDKLEHVELGFINIELEKMEFSHSLEDKGSLNLNVYHKKEAARVDFSDFFIKGDARGRVIIYKPDLGKVSVLPSDFNSDFSADIKFKISKDGFVKYAECIVSSGFSEIDQAAIRYVRKWLFVPDSEDDQEGVVRVSFK